MRPINTNVLNVTAMPRVLGVIRAKIRSDKKAMEKKKVIDKIPAPIVGYSRIGMSRLKL